VLATPVQPVTNLRVRDLGDVGRVELDPELVATLSRHDDTSRALLAAVTSAGFPAAVVDPQGFRSGSMNALLTEPDSHR
jgi:pyridinium-3,5-biscarboxylic acid mononucleotide sulfurtransferase